MQSVAEGLLDKGGRGKIDREGGGSRGKWGGREGIAVGEASCSTRCGTRCGSGVGGPNPNPNLAWWVRP